MSAMSTMSATAIRATFSAPKTGAARRTNATMKKQNKSLRNTALRAVSDPEVVESSGALESAARGMGYDTSEGIFGFNPFAELWVGRLAMSGFTVGFAEE